MTTMTIRTKLLSSLLNFWLMAFAFSAALIWGDFASCEEKPNIIFLLSDDQTTSTIGCYGNSLIQTPNLDQLAREGVRFNNAFVSHSICWVSRTSMLCGLTGRTYGSPDEQDQARAEAVKHLYSDRLREAGYRTGFIGKWHAKMPEGYKPREHFDVYEPIQRNPYFKKQPDGSLRHETDLIVDRGLEFIGNQPSDKPFALNLWFNACHGEDDDRRPGIGHFPWPQSSDGLYENVVIPPPRLGEAKIFDSLPEFLRVSINRERYFWRWNTPEKYQLNMRAYYRMATGIDNAIGRLLAYLKQQGIEKNTIIVYSADNGYYMGNRGLTGKWSHYDESLRVPLIIYDPRLPEDRRGKVVDQMTLNLDLPATFMDWATGNIPEEYQGKSLRPLLGSASIDSWRSETFHEHFAVRNRIPAFEGVRTLSHKYARYVDHEGYELLHDLVNDPDELVNLANDPTYAEVLKELRSKTDEYVMQYGGKLSPLKGSFQKSTDPYPVASAMVGATANQEGFVSLFNGKNLQGWEGDPQYWSVEEGALTGKADGSLKMNRFITWKGSTVRNFDLRMKVRVTPGGNSGIQYRGLMRPEIGLDIVSGYQCDVVADVKQYNGMLYEERGRRILSHTGEKVMIDSDGSCWVVGTMPVQDFAPNEWHEFRVLVEGNHHRHWIDGYPTADLLDFDEQGRALEGVLGMQVHVGPAMKIQYKDILIKHLPDDLPLLKKDDHPIPADAYGVRPQGNVPSDWTPPVYGK
jgi:choline-sulfatase